MKTRCYSLVSATIFAVVSVVHIIRVMRGMPVQIGDYLLPGWIMWVAMAVAIGMSIWGFRTARR
ncbi:MAG: hypothetical protein SGI97_02200 [candidate division Zixibacteria bacterium]|nr:hypothetical protein [candidate division Zixibacteria bacterium]